MHHKTLFLMHLLKRDHRIVIPASLTSTPPRGAGQAVSGSGVYDNLRNYPSAAIADIVGDASGEELKSRLELNKFREAVAHQNETIWRDSKSHLRKQKTMVETFGVEGAVRETLKPSTISFHKEIMARPLDRKILEEIYRGLHGRRVERKLKRGVSWEHWIAKGDGNAPVFNTSAKTQQTFGYGGKLKKIVSAQHERQFPSTKPPVPEVAFIGRTNSGKSSLINAIVNAFVCPYGQLQGTTTSCDFYSAADKVTIVDLPGYG